MLKILSGSISTMLVIDKFNRKYLLLINLLLNGVGMWTFTVTKKIGFLYFNRVFLGIFQVNYLFYQ
jgi:predicted MFS family arabinose efflux permease